MDLQSEFEVLLNSTLFDDDFEETTAIAGMYRLDNSLKSILKSIFTLIITRAARRCMFLMHTLTCTHGRELESTF